MVILKEIEDLYNNFSSAVYTPKYLDAKTKELIAFSNSIMIDCKHCIKAHYNRAKQVGVTDNEIYEAVAISMAVAAGKNRGIVRDIISNNNSGNES